MSRMRFSISISRVPNLLNASRALASDVHSGVSRCPRYTSSEECFDRISMSVMPRMVWNWLVMVWMNTLSASFPPFCSCLYSSSPSPGIFRRLTVGRFGRDPA
uniref:Uncharacterized protein n=1 Tax=Triticum urartu TaxID=4572 RepID=A0A8R7VCA1_TRIUA